MLDRVEAAFFDLDKTVIAKASMVAFGRPLYRAGLLSRRTLLRALWGQVVYLQIGADEQRMLRVRRSVLRLAKGWDQARVSEIVRETIDEVIEPIVYDEAIELIRAHRDAGRRIVLVSASPTEIVAPLALYLGVHDAIATRAELDDDGRYTGEVEFYSYGPYKVDAMDQLAALHGIDLESSYAYSDSATDLPMLEAVGHPIAVNPDRALLRVARARDWEVVRFGREVTLRSRVPMPRPAHAAAGGLAGLVAGAVVWWWLRRPSARQRDQTDAGWLRPNGLSWRQRQRVRRARPGSAASSWPRSVRARRAAASRSSLR
jgi:HAD superfamily hydrolase (TIGR01490 family)